MKKEIAQVLQNFEFDKALCIFRKLKPNSFWADELENESDTDYAHSKLKELLKREYEALQDEPEELRTFDPPAKIKGYKKKVNESYALMRTSHAQLKNEKSEVVRKELAFRILSCVANIRSYMSIVRHWERTGKVVEGELQEVTLQSKKKEIEDKPLPTNPIVLLKEYENLGSYISRAPKRNVSAEKVAYWKDRKQRIEKILNAIQNE